MLLICRRPFCIPSAWCLEFLKQWSSRGLPLVTGNSWEFHFVSLISLASINTFASEEVKHFVETESSDTSKLMKCSCHSAFTAHPKPLLGVIIMCQYPVPIPISQHTQKKFYIFFSLLGDASHLNQKNWHRRVLKHCDNMFKDILCSFLLLGPGLHLPLVQ